MNKKVVFLPYDFDTALGINNEGALVFNYNLEDTDQVGGEDVYNGQQSVLWCNLRDMFKTELQEMYQSLRSNGALSYEKVEKAFEDHQSKWPEAVFNEDAFFKYIQPLIDDGDDTYLSMRLGSKAEQRKWWLYNRFRYIDSKYNCGDALTDYIQIRGYEKGNITVTPYADVYIGIKWASMLRQQRGTRNTPYVMACPLDNVNDTEIYIYSASQLSSVGDLSSLRVGFADFHSATKLRELIIGSPAAGYVNNNLRSVNVGRLGLLKKIDVRNCAGLGTYADQKSVDLSGCSGIEEVYFDGTNVLGVMLPNGGFLKKLHLPGTITNLTIQNQTGITEFVCPDFSHVSTLVLESNGNSVDVQSIVQHVAAGCRIRISGYRWDFQDIDAVHDFLDYFDGMQGIDQNGDNEESPQLFFTVHVPTATGDQIDSVLERYPNIIVDADVATLTLRYWDTEGTEVLYTETVEKGQNGTYAGQPYHAPTARWSYVFTGWNTRRNADEADPDALNNLETNRNVYAAYTKTVRTYMVRFLNDDGTILQIYTNVSWGATVSYTGETPVHSEEPETMAFIGFSPDGSNITSDTYCYAVYQDTNELIIQYLSGTIHDIDDDVMAIIPEHTFDEQRSLINVRLAASTIERYAFYNATALEVLDLTCQGALNFEPRAIAYCRALKALILRSNSVVPMTQSAMLAGNVASMFAGGYGFIYVPDHLLSSYKSHGIWGELSKRIRSINDYPVAEIPIINMTLPQIKAAVEDESFFTMGYQALDVIPFSYGGREVYADIVKIDAENKYVDFIIHYFAERCKFYETANASQTFEDSNYITRLTEIYEEELTSEIQACSTPITQYYANIDGTESEITAPLWVPTTRNMAFGISSLETHGEIYECFQNKDYLRVKFALPNSDVTDETTYSLASVQTNNAFQKVITRDGGTTVSSGITYGRAFVFGFRVQKSGGE